MQDKIKGKLIYLVGASGAGKDTILDASREDAFFCTSCAFAHRYITRPSNVGSENHVALSHEEFANRKERGLFALEWQAHDTHYGIGKEIDTWVENGLNAIVNGSRSYLPEVQRLYPEVITVWVTVDSDVLMQRLLNRGRESLPEIQKRIQRNNELEALRSEGDSSGWVEVKNNADISDGVKNFKDAVKKALNH